MGGPEAMFFAPNNGPEFEIWAWDYHAPNIPSAERVGDIWYKTDTWELATASPTWRRDSTDAGTPPAWETSCAMDAEQRVFHFLSKYKNKKKSIIFLLEKQ